MNDTTAPESSAPGLSAPSLLKRPDGQTIAYHHLPGKSPGVIFLGGFMSDMAGSKALALEEAARTAGRAFTRFDYLGHGQSSGKFRDGTISRWKEDALAVIDEVTDGPLVLVGSSMGGWIMLLAALARPGRVKGLVGIAPAPDFTVSMWEEEFDDDIRAILRRDGVYLRPSEYSEEPYPITMDLIEDGKSNLLLDKPIPLACPVRLLHGMRDTAVPWRHSLSIADKLEAEDVTITFVKAGDHRLSEEADIACLTHTVEDLCRQLEEG